MSPQAYKTTVGAFVLGGLGLLVLGIALLGGGRLFSNDIEYVLYFDGSVSGLSIGAPVVFRGVPMGRVTRISLVANARDSNVTIPVHIRIDERSIVRAGGGPTPAEAFQQEIIRRMVQRGLRARLQMQSLITGQYRVELDFFPNSPANFRSSTPDLEIPTVPSPIDALQRTLAKVPLDQMLLYVENILQSLSLAVSDGKLERAIAAFGDTFSATRDIVSNDKMRNLTTETLGKLDEILAAVRLELPETLRAFRQAMQSTGLAADELRKTSASARSILERDSPVLIELQRLLKEGTAAARSLRGLTDMIERNPESLIQGRKGLR